MSSPTAMPSQSTSMQAWWREPTMWLVVGGPAIVVVASFLTLFLAIRFPDPVIEDHGQGNASNAVTSANAKALAPAMKARNHAATGGQ